MKIVKSFVVILYSVNAINHNLANLQSELIIMIIKTTSRRNVCFMWEKIIMF